MSEEFNKKEAIQESLQEEKTSQPADQTANTLIAGGVVVGAAGALGAVLAGAVCPLCVVATPVLVGCGVGKKILDRKKERKTEK